MANINLDDLSEKDLEKLMAQAMAKIEEQRITANAKAEYKQKRIKLVEELTNSIYPLASFNDVAKKNLYKRFISIVNFLYKGCTWGFSCNKSNPDIDITTKEQWEEYERIATILTSSIKKVITYGEE